MILQASYRLLLTLVMLAAFAAATPAQDRTLWITEADGSPSGRNITKIIVTNGSLSISGQTATITTGGGGGGTPGGSTNQAQFNAGAGSFGGSSAITMTTTTANITTGSVLNALTMTLGSDATGDIYYRAAGGALTRLAIGSAAQVLTVSGGLPAWAAGGTGTVTSVGQTFTGGLISVSGSPVTTSGTLALTVAGTSGGIPYFSSASTWASSGALTANLPVIGGGAGVAPTVGTRSGNTTQFVTTTGTLTSGDCVKIDASGNFVANGSACGGGGTPAGSTGDYQINNAGAFGAGVIAQGTTGRVTVTPTLQSSGVASYFRVITPVDTGQTASTESIGLQFGGNTSAATVTRTWAAGALTTQRENVFVAPTYAFVGASTITTAATLAITGAPAAGTNATITTPLALWTQTGNVSFGSAGTGFFWDNTNARLGIGTSSPARTIHLQTTGTNVTGVRVANGSGSFLFYVGVAGSGFGFFDENASLDRFVIDTNGLIGVNKASSLTGQLDVVSGAAGRTGLQIVSASSATVALNNLVHESDQTAAVRTHTQFYSRSNGTAAAGFGGQLLFGLESSTTNDRDAAAIQWLWSTATDASRSADIVFSNVNGAAALAETFRITANALPVWPNTVTADGTTGNQTINKPSGTVNIAAAGTAVTVTNSVVTSNSLVFAIARTNDATCRVANAVPGSGTVTINMTAACTAETSIGFFVINK